METPPFFCEKCGAANQAGTETCFACKESLQAAAAQAELHQRNGPGFLLNVRYLIISQVGMGGFGAVYKAKDIQSGDRPVAIKEINLHGLKAQQVIEATDTFNREVMLLASLTHPNLPRLYDHFTDAQHWYLVMDFIEGETLEEYLQKIRDGYLPLHDVLDIGIQLCTVLDYLHTRQPAIIFRDVKPANIMRTPRGHLYLIDFGTARQFKAGQAKDTIALGSPGYAAPEQYGKAQTTQQSDIYSLGVTLHQLLTGNDPSENPFRLPPLRSSHASLPAELETLLTQMLDLVAGQRPASVAAVKEELEHIAFQQSRALYALQPSTASNQVVASPPVASGVTAGKGMFLPWAAIISKRLITNVIMTGLALLFVVGSCSFFSSLMRVREESCNCAPSGPSQAPFNQQIYRSPLVGITNSTVLDPALAADAQSINATGMVFSSLVRLDDNFTVHPQLVSSWNVSADGQVWTFYLYPDLRFSDGTLLTAADVAYSIDRTLQPATGSTTSLTYLGLMKDADKLHAGQIPTIIGDSILTPNDYTVVIKTRKPAMYFLDALAYPGSYVVEKSLIEKYGNQKFTEHLTEGGGDGPFVVQKYIRGKEIDLVPNAFYSGSRPLLQKVILPFYKDVEASLQAYQADQVDTTAIPEALVLQDRTRYDFHQDIQLTTYYYAMNYLVKPFDNIHVRQAFALALNKDAIVNAVWKDEYFPTNHIVPRGMLGYNPMLTGPAGEQFTIGDTGKARTLLQQGLQEEGWSNVAQLPPITFTYASTSPTFDKEVAAVRAMWQSVLGINVQLHPVSAGTLHKEVSATTYNPRGLQFWAASWSADYPDPQDWTTLQFDNGSPYNNMNYGQNNASDHAQQQAIQQQLETADTTANPDTRTQAYRNAEQQLVNDVAWLPMYQANAAFLRKPYVNGIPYSSGLEIPLYDWASIYIAVH